MIARHTALAERCVQAAGDPTDGADRWAAVLHQDRHHRRPHRRLLAGPRRAAHPRRHRRSPRAGAAYRRRRAGAVADREPGGRVVVAPRPAPRRRHHHRHRHRCGGRAPGPPRLDHPPGGHPRRGRHRGDHHRPALAGPRRPGRHRGRRRHRPHPTRRRTRRGCWPATWTPCGRTSTPPCCCCTSAPSPTPNHSTPTHPRSRRRLRGAAGPGRPGPAPAARPVRAPSGGRRHRDRRNRRQRRRVVDGELGEVPGPTVEPVDDTVAPEDPQVLVTVAPDPEVDTAALGRAREAVAAAWDYYRQQAARSWVPGYLTGRGLDPALAGYAPAGWTRLVDHLRTQGFTDTELLAAGLARTGNRDNTLIDRFSNRVMLPIHDTDGTVIAFVGRKHPADTNPAAPKYVNSPTTDLFRKTDLPYGLTTDNIEKLRAGADLVIVEGPMDAHAVTAAAAPAKDLRLVAVAPLGTALTAEQLATINGIGPLTDRRVIVALDNDHAGTKAARNALRLLAAAGVSQPRHHHPPGRAGPRPGPRRPRPRRTRRRPHPPPAPGRPRRRRHHRLLARPHHPRRVGHRRRVPRPAGSRPDHRPAPRTRTEPASRTPRRRHRVRPVHRPGHHRAARPVQRGTRRGTATTAATEVAHPDRRSQHPARSGNHHHHHPCCTRRRHGPARTQRATAESTRRHPAGRSRGSPLPGH